MNKYPVIPFTCIFISGIWLSAFIKIDLLILPYFVVFFVTGVILYFLFKNDNKAQSVFPVYLYLVVFFTGLMYYRPSAVVPFRDQIQKEEIKIFGSIIEREIGDKLKFTLESDSLIFRGYVFSLKGKYYCSIKKEAGNKINIDPRPGNKISLTGMFFEGRNSRNPGEFDFDNYLRITGFEGYVYSSVGDLRIMDSGKSFLGNSVYEIRKYMSDVLDKYQERKTAGLLKGLVLADRADISQDIKEDFVNTGTAHVLAVSGLNVAYIILMIIFLTGRMNLFLRFIFSCMGIIIFIFITGASASVLRASYMALILAIAFITNRSTNLYNSLALSALSILLISPEELFLPGFQLSYLSIISLIVFYPIINSEIDKIHFKYISIKKILLFCTVTIAAQIGTFPLIFYYFSKLSLISVLSNIIVVPLIGVITGTAFVTIIFASSIPFISSAFAVSNNFFCSFLLAFEKLTGNPAISFLWIRQFSFLDGMIFYTVAVVFTLCIKRVISVYTKITLVILCISIIVIFTSLDNKDLFNKNLLNCYMLDVGQGDAILLQFPGGKTALIDAGETTANYDTGERIIVPLMNYLAIDKIDYGFISHFDADHYSGFVHLIKNGYLKEVYIPPRDTSERCRKFCDFLKQFGIKPFYYSGNILKERETRIYILGNNDITTKKHTTNDACGVILVCYGQTRFLFTGDAGLKAEEYYLRRFGEFLKADVLKVSHHGSKYASSERFLAEVKPSISLISDGEKNKFGHPSEIILNRLNNINSRIYRTDKDCGILLQSDGINIKFINWKDRGEL